MRLFFLIVFLTGSQFILSAQTDTSRFRHFPGPLKKSLPGTSRQHRTTGTEICGNLIDDDGNGLIDNEDYHCYFSNALSDCQPSRVVWSCTNYGLIWVDLATGTEKFVGEIGRTIYDLTWTSEGKLYGMDPLEPALCEIDPETASILSMTRLPAPYYTSNALTADDKGNMIMDAITTTGAWHIIQFNPVTKAVKVIANLSAAGVSSGGDITFLNGYLYLGCDNGNLAKITPSTGAIELLPVKDRPMDRIMGLITLGDGYLYMSAINKIYRIDPVTVTASKVATYDFLFPDIYMLGLTAYPELCNAGGCHGRVKIHASSTDTVCSNIGIGLKAQGGGIIGSAVYDWYMPNGKTSFGDSIQAYVSGTYTVRYHTNPDTCGVQESIVINIRQTANASLGNDTLVCPGKQVLIQPRYSDSSCTYSWSTGSTSPSISITDPGIYILQATNQCGISKDTIQVLAGLPPVVQLPEDLAICPGTAIPIGNLADKQYYDSYTWSVPTTTDSIMVSQPGRYWLQSANACGVTSDSLIVSFKDSCSCFPLYPKADLGPSKEYCRYDTMFLENKFQNAQYHFLWQDGTSGTRLPIKAAGVYWLEVSTYCGQVRDSVIIIDKGLDCEQAVYVPNAFTPDRNGINEIFKPIVRGTPLQYSLRIFNRWGELVFSTKDWHYGWDGSFKGKLSGNGIYAWTCTYQFASKQPFTKKGTVTLLR